jgi:hypothetical protein
MLNEGGDLLSSYLSDMPVVPTTRRLQYLTGRMLNASTAQRIVWPQLLGSFLMTTVIPVIYLQKEIMNAVRTRMLANACV